MANLVDQGLSTLRKAQEYVKVGVDALPEFASEFVELGRGDDDGAEVVNINEEFKSVVSSFIKMEQDLEAYAHAVEEVKAMVMSANFTVRTYIVTAHILYALDEPGK